MLRSHSRNLYLNKVLGDCNELGRNATNLEMMMRNNNNATDRAEHDIVSSVAAAATTVTPKRQKGNASSNTSKIAQLVENTEYYVRRVKRLKHSLRSQDEDNLACMQNPHSLKYMDYLANSAVVTTDKSEHEAEQRSSQLKGCNAAITLIAATLILIGVALLARCCVRFLTKDAAALLSPHLHTPQYKDDTNDDMTRLNTSFVKLANQVRTNTTSDRLHLRHHHVEMGRQIRALHFANRNLAIQHRTLNEKLKRMQKLQSDSVHALEAQKSANEIMETKLQQLKQICFQFFEEYKKSEATNHVDFVLKKHVDQLADFALGSMGAQIVHTRTSRTYSPHGDRDNSIGGGGRFFWRGFQSSSVAPVTYKPPEAILEPDVHPGNCWAFAGQSGHVTVRLSTPTQVSAVSLDHIAEYQSVQGCVASAPKHFEILAVNGDNSQHSTSVIRLANFTFEYPAHERITTQTFNFQAHFTEAIQLNIISNHGHPNYTCVYRFRVHGITPQQQRKRERP